MKFIVSSSLLLKNLQSVSGVLNPNNRTLPILDNFLFELNEDSLCISASDLDTTITAKIPVTKSEEQGTIAIPAKILLDSLKTFSDVPVTFAINQETFRIEISAGEGKYKITGYKGEEFPKIPILENVASIEINSSILSNAISKTIFATGNDELRPVMSGIYCELSPEKSIFVATDAHRLVRYIRTDVQSDAAASFILPKKPLNQIKNILLNADTNVKIEYNETNASFSFDNINLVCRLIEGNYPNYEAVIPQENPNKLTIEKLPFLNSIKRVSIFANQSTYFIKFKITGRELVILAEDLDFSNEAKERLNCQYEGEDIEIGFNARFIVEMLNNLESDEVCLNMSASNRAAIFLPVNKEEKEKKEEDILMLAMPVMLND
jgi:DNA polymerase-3 subunit beta